MTAVSKGLDAYVAVDASGTFSETKRQVGYYGCCRRALYCRTTRR
jgi:hypothetical protein